MRSVMPVSRYRIMPTGITRTRKRMTPIDGHWREVTDHQVASVDEATRCDRIRPVRILVVRRASMDTGSDDEPTLLTYLGSFAELTFLTLVYWLVGSLPEENHSKKGNA